MKSRAWCAPVEALRLLFVVYASMPAILTLLGKGIQGGTHDGGDHLYRLLDLDVTLRSGVLFPRIAPHLASDYSYATFTFYSPFGVYLGEAFHLAGLGYIAALKSSFAVSVLLAGFGAYLLARDLYGWRGGILAGVAYAYFPFLLVDIYTRGDLAESLAMGCLPFVFWSFRRLAGQPTPGRVSAAGLSYALLILSHNLTALFATPILLAFLLVTRRGRLTFPTVLGVGAGGLLAILLSAAYLLPVANGFSRLNPGAVTGGFFDYHRWFIPLDQLLQYHWEYDYRYAFEYGARFNAGRTIILFAALASVWVLIARPAGYRLLVFGAGVLAALLWLQTSSSVFLWDHVPPMRYLQFPYRLNALSGVPAVLLVGAFLARPLRPRFGTDWLILGKSAFSMLGALLAIGILFAVPITSLAHLPSGHLDTQESEVNLPSLWRLELDRGLIASATRGDYLPPTVPGDFYQLLSTLHAPSAAQRTKVELTAVQFEPLRLAANVQATAAGTLVFDRIADPVWTATIDGKPVKIGTTGPIGELTVAVPAGHHQLVLAAEETPPGRIGDVLSLCAAVVILAVIVGPWRPGWEKRLVVVSLLAAAAVAVIAPRIQPPRLLDTSANFGQAVRLVGGRLDRASSNPPGAVDVTLVWETLQSPLADCTVHLRLLDARGSVVAERDKPPLFGVRSCTTMPAGEVFRDVQQIRLPPGVPPGPYRLAVSVSVGNSLLAPDGRASPISWQDPGQPDGTLSHGVLLGTIDAPAGPVAATLPLGRHVGATVGGDFQLESARVTAVPCPGTSCSGSSSQSFSSLSPALTRFFPFLVNTRPDVPIVSQDPRFVARLAPGGQINVNLLWRSLRDVSADYSVFTHLESPGHKLVAQDDDWPDRTNFPTSVWFPGDTLVDRYYIVTKPSVSPGVYNLSTGMYLRATGKRLSASGPLAADNQINLGTVKVSSRDQVFGTPFSAGKLSISLDREIQLAGSQVVASPTLTEPVSVHLVWHALRRPTADYTVFVHVLDRSGKLVAQHDSQPLADTYPTRDWDAGDMVYDALSIPLPSDLPPGQYQVHVGMYNLKTGQRLSDPSGRNEFTAGEFIK